MHSFDFAGSQAFFRSLFAPEARAGMRRITADQLEAKTVNASALKQADAQLAEAEAELFQAEIERSVARAELERTLGEE